MPTRPRQAKVGSTRDHLRAVVDCNTMLAALGECWRLANDGLRDEMTAKALAEALVRIKAEADQAVRKVMTPGN